MLSVICPIYNEEKYIAQCIESLLLQDYPQNDLEILFVDGMSTDKTREIIASYTRKYPFIKMLDNPKKIVPYAMNTGIKASKGEIIIRLDGHVEYPTNYFSALVKNLKELDADNVGALCETLPCGPSSKELAIAEALSSSFPKGKYQKVELQLYQSLETLTEVPSISSYINNKKRKVCLMSYLIKRTGDNAVNAFNRNRLMEAEEAGENGAQISCPQIEQFGFDYYRISHDYSFRISNSK